MADPTVTVLHFVTGKYQGQEFPLDAESFIAGRSTEADLVLADDAVSRKHVRFYAKRGRIWVRDLGSRNGTHVNGKEVHHHCLRDGDRLVIGSSLLRIDTKAPADLASNRAGEQRRRRPNDSAGRSMTGSIEDIPLMDVLQWLATSRKTGCLKVRDPGQNRTGSLHLRDGLVFYAAIEGNNSLHPEKALMRMLNWQKGMFELENKIEENPAETLNMSLEHMLMEAARQQDELAALQGKKSVPTENSDVKLVHPSPVRWKELDGEILDVIQEIVAYGKWSAVLDNSQLNDVSLYKAIVAAKKKGVVEY
jgi:hypothetical protein